MPRALLQALQRLDRAEPDPLLFFVHCHRMDSSPIIDAGGGKQRGV